VPEQKLLVSQGWLCSIQSGCWNSSAHKTNTPQHTTV